MSDGEKRARRDRVEVLAGCAVIAAAAVAACAVLGFAVRVFLWATGIK